MHKSIDILKKFDLFTGICTENIGKILDHFNANICSFNEGEYILRKNHELNKIAVFLDGNVFVGKDPEEDSKDVDEREERRGASGPE